MADLVAEVRTVGGRTDGVETCVVDGAVVGAGGVLAVGFGEWPEQPTRLPVTMVATTVMITPRRNMIIFRE